MKLVWKADDGTIFETKEACELHEAILDIKLSLRNRIQQINPLCDEEEAESYVGIITELCYEPTLINVLINLLKEQTNVH